MDINKVIGSLHQIAPQLRTVSELQAKADDLTKILSESGDVTGLGFDSNTPLIDQVNAALCTSYAQARLEACIAASKKNPDEVPPPVGSAGGEGDQTQPQTPPNTEGSGEQRGWSWGSIGRWTIFGVSLYQLLGIFRSEKNWFKVILGAIGTAVTAFWNKIKGAFGGASAPQAQAEATSTK